MDCYIYYKTEASLEAQVLQHQTELSASLLQTGGPSLHLQRRPEAIDGLHTWMEIYRQIPQGFETDLNRLVQCSGLIPLIHGKRHVEYFMDAISCA